MVVVGGDLTPAIKLGFKCAKKLWKCFSSAQDSRSGDICNSNSTLSFRQTGQQADNAVSNPESFQSAVESFNVPSPLDPFEMIPLIPMNIGDLYFSFKNPSFFMLLTLSFVLLLLYFVKKKKINSK